MTKRGISPLIASVLLIAFAITLFLIISTWVQRSVVEPGLEKGGEKVASTLDCLGTKVDIVDACKSGDNQVRVKVDNVGDMVLNGVQIRVIGTTSIESIVVTESIPPLDRYDSGVKNLVGDIGTITGVEVYPQIKSGLCKSNPATKTTMNAC